MQGQATHSALQCNLLNELHCRSCTGLGSQHIKSSCRSIDYHMDFWKARLKRGNNTMFLALSRGPKKFVQALGELLRRMRGRPSRIMLRPTHRIEQRVRHALLARGH